MDYWYKKHPVYFKVSHYQNNGSLAIMMMIRDKYNVSGYHYGTVTVNLPDSFLLDKDTQFIDENNMPGVGKWLEENELATPTEIIQQSGFCTYRAYKFNMDKINK